MNPYIGPDFDDLLAEDGIQEDVTAAALKRVLAYQLEQAMKKHGVNQTEMARRMKTSHTTVRQPAGCRRYQRNASYPVPCQHGTERAIATDVATYVTLKKDGVSGGWYTT